MGAETSPPTVSTLLAVMTTGSGLQVMLAMVSKSSKILPIWGGILLVIVGCGEGAGNTPEMGKVPPKPNLNMNARLPSEIQSHMSQAKPSSDAAKMGSMKPHSGKP